MKISEQLEYSKYTEYSARGRTPTNRIIVWCQFVSDDSKHIPIQCEICQLNGLESCSPISVISSSSERKSRSIRRIHVARLLDFIVASFDMFFSGCEINEAQTRQCKHSLALELQIYSTLWDWQQVRTVRCVKILLGLEVILSSNRQLVNMPVTFLLNSCITM